MSSELGMKLRSVFFVGLSALSSPSFAMIGIEDLNSYEFRVEWLVFSGFRRYLVFFLAQCTYMQCVLCRSY